MQAVEAGWVYLAACQSFGGGQQHKGVGCTTAWACAAVLPRLAPAYRNVPSGSNCDQSSANLKSVHTDLNGNQEGPLVVATTPQVFTAYDAQEGHEAVLWAGVLVS